MGLGFGIGSNYQWSAVRKFLTPDLRALGKRNIKYTREDIHWATVQPTEGVWNWDSYDSLFAGIASQNMELLPVLGYGTAWATGTDVNALPKTDEARDRFVIYAMEAVKRYGTTGTFWQDNPGLTFLPPTAWDIWNEPWYPGPADPNDYAKLIRAVSPAVKTVDPSISIVINCDDRVRKLADGSNANWSTAVLNALPDAADYVDVFSIHPYPRGDRPAYVSAVEDSLNQVTFLRSQLAGRDLRHPVWVTEVGFTDLPTPRDPNNSKTTAAADTFAFINGLRQMSYVNETNTVQRSYIFTSSRPNSGSANPGAWDYGYNLIDETGRLKPALLAYCALATE